MAEDAQDMLLTLTADIVAAHVSNNSVGLADLPDLITRVHGALAGLGSPVVEPVEEPKPAVSIRSSVKPDYIICLEDGKKLKMMRRHEMTAYGERKSVGKGKSVSVRVGLGGRHIIKKKKQRYKDKEQKQQKK